MTRFTAGSVLDAAGIDRGALRRLLPRVDPDRVTVRRAPGWFRRLWPRRIVAVAMPWAIYLEPATFARDRSRIGRLIVHELVHIEQWRRLGALGHLRLYLGDYVRGRLAGKGHWDSYRDIRLEVEARRVAASLEAE